MSFVNLKQCVTVFIVLLNVVAFILSEVAEIRAYIATRFFENCSAYYT